MKTAKDFRDVEKAFREVADAAAKCAELEEKGGGTNEEREEALKNLMWAIARMNSM